MSNVKDLFPKDAFGSVPIFAWQSTSEIMNDLNMAIGTNTAVRSVAMNFILGDAGKMDKPIPFLFWSCCKVVVKGKGIPLL